MNESWFYGSGGQQHGPVSIEELKQLARARQLEPTDLVWKEGMASWAPAKSVEGLFALQPPPLLPNAHSGSAPSPTLVTGTGEGRRLAVLILTIIGGVFGLMIGGCTGAASEGLSSFGEELSELDRKYGNGSDYHRMRKDAREIRGMGQTQVMFGFLQAVIGIAGGVYSFVTWHNPARVQIGTYRPRRLLFGAIGILLAAVLSLFNCFSIMTAGLMNTIAGILVVLQARQGPSVDLGGG